MRKRMTLKNLDKLMKTIKSNIKREIYIPQNNKRKRRYRKRK